jgi:formylglycine-generating enzyme required for sulfatase activity
MGAVYLATDQRFGSTVALKQTLVNGENLRKAFEREARLLNGLRHAALPVVIDYFTEAEDVFLVMQYIPGDDLYTRLEKSGGPFRYEEVLLWADQLLDALDYLHTHQPPIIHRDIKPQNLKITKRGEVILLDFGLAKGSAEMALSTSSASIFGYTPTYAPFEQIQGSGTDARSDIYSLGATAYHLMTGETPADALTRTSSLLSGQADPLRRADEVNNKIPPAVGAVLMQAMALNRNDRPETAVELRHALRQASQNLEPGIASTVIASSKQKTVAQSGPAAAVTVRANDPMERGRKTAVEAPARRVDADLAKAAAARTIAETHDEGRSKRWLWVALLALVLVGGGAALFLTGVLGPGKEVTAPANPAPPPTVTEPANPGASAPAASFSVPPFKTFNFEVVTVDATGKPVGRSRNEAQTFAEDLGAGVTLEMVLVPGGTYLMGSPDTEKQRFGEEGPQHNVEVPGFYMGKFEVTQAQWQAVASLPKVNRDMNPNPSNFEGVNRPVQKVSYQDAVEFCDRLSKKTGRPYRLPSEAQWEYACRAGTTTPFYFGEALPGDHVNYDARSPYGAGEKGAYRNTTLPVGGLNAPNAFGLYDMHGSLWEWCLDPWHSDYKGAPRDGSSWEAGGNNGLRVIRGGAWNRIANHCRSAYRLKNPATERLDVIGFRVVVVPDGKK